MFIAHAALHVACVAVHPLVHEVWVVAHAAPHPASAAESS
jgi:hypothetical protein